MSDNDGETKLRLVIDDKPADVGLRDLNHGEALVDRTGVVFTVIRDGCQHLVLNLTHGRLSDIGSVRGQRAQLRVSAMRPVVPTVASMKLCEVFRLDGSCDLFMKVKPDAGHAIFNLNDGSLVCVGDKADGPDPEVSGDTPVQPMSATMSVEVDKRLLGEKSESEGG